LSANSALSSLTLVYVSYFLLEVVGLRPALAGLVPLIGRVVDAVTDPMMGRISDHYRIRGERRRPYFLIASLPYALSFAMLWFQLDTDSQWLQFFYYAVAYSVMSTSLTVLVIPYLALVPEMAIDYDERTSCDTAHGKRIRRGWRRLSAGRPGGWRGGCRLLDGRASCELRTAGVCVASGADEPRRRPS
jgi:Na+/melibiose symporter-like transporter